MNQPDLPLFAPLPAPPGVEPVAEADSEAREARRSALAPAPAPAKRTPAQPRSAETGLQGVGGGGPLCPPSPPIKTAGGPLPGAKTPPSGVSVICSPSDTPKTASGGVISQLPGVPAALASRLVPILRRAGYILPGDPAWRSPAELEGWFAAPREELGGRAWAEVHVPFLAQDRMRFAHAMDQIDREAEVLPP
jgi:hypothetical protein